VKIALVTDAWAPQVNGVARTLAALRDGLIAAGHETAALSPDLFRTVRCPTDPEVGWHSARVRRWRAVWTR
jgi:hypothetical protein